jgi:phage-related protein
MLADGINISNFGGMLLSLDVGNAQFDTKEEWLKNSSSPILLSEKFYYKKITTEILIQGLSRQDSILKMSNLTNLLKKCTLKFDDLDFYYDAVMVSNTSTKTIEIEKLVLKCEFNVGYAYKAEVTETMNRITSKAINVPGNLETPAIIEITPSIALIDIVLTGLGKKSIKINNVTASKKIILNGEDCTVTELGLNKFGDTELWSFPSLKQGSNTITSSRNNVDITIKYKPRFI